MRAVRSQWIVLFIAVFALLACSQVNVEAAGSNNDNGTVAEHFKNQQSPGNGGQKQKINKSAPLTTSSGTIWMFVKVILVLAIVIALIYFLLRFVNARTRSFSDGRAIRNVGGISVGSNRSVQLVKVGKRIFVVGVGETVSLLKEIGDTEEVQELLEENHREDVIDHSIWKFRDWLKQKTSPETGKGHFKTMFEDRLKQMVQERKQTLDKWKKKGDKE